VDRKLALKAKHDLGAYAIVMGQPYYRLAPHLALLSDILMRVERRELRRVIVSMPPRHGKSMLVSQFFPAWYLGRNVRRQVIHATYSGDLASGFGREIRNQIRDDFFREIFPGVELISDSKAVDKFNTSTGGIYIATGVDGSITGRGADLFLIDDPIKGRAEADSSTMRQRLKDWFGSVAYTRLMPGGAVVIVQTRWHEDDLAGHCIRELQHEGWTVVSLKAIAEGDDPLGRQEGEVLWSDQFPLATIEDIKRTLPSRDFSALYQQSPMPSEGGLVKLKWFRRFPNPLQRLEVASRIIQSYDTATKAKEINDWSVGTTWADTKEGLDLVDVFRARLEYPDLRRSVIANAERFRPSVILIEDKGSGQVLIQDLRASTRLPIVAIDPGQRDKVVRFSGVTGMIEAGRVGLPESAPWLVDYEMEMTAFPVAAHDDQADSTSQALEYWRDSISKFVVLTGPSRQSLDWMKGYNP
jgi:predicted phage terminase large subunit-like protein